MSNSSKLVFSRETNAGGFPQIFHLSAFLVYRARSFSACRRFGPTRSDTRSESLASRLPLWRFCPPIWADCRRDFPSAEKVGAGYDHAQAKKLFRNLLDVSARIAATMFG